MSANKKVSLGWQVMATIFFPIGLYAFKRIGKLRNGILIYLGSFGLLVLGVVALVSMASDQELLAQQFLDEDYRGEWFDALWEFSLAWNLTNIAMPMVFIAKWTKQWNESIDRQNAVL